MKPLAMLGSILILGACTMTPPPRTAPPIGIAPPIIDAPYRVSPPVRTAPPSPPPTTAQPPRVAPPSTMPPPMAEDACGASTLQHLVGGVMPYPFPSRGNPVRVFRTGDPVTMDHNPSRINVEMNRAGSRIRAITCG